MYARERRVPGVCIRVLGLLALVAQVLPAAAQDAQDYWLDDTYSDKALQWVAEENAKTLTFLGGEAALAPLELQAAEVLTEPSRLASVQVVGEYVLEYRQTRAAPLGRWRISSRTRYFAGKAVWKTLLDLDQLARDEGRRWIFNSANCRATHCLLSLSDNGKDAHEVREFDLATASFVSDGFFIPEGKTRSWWYDDDHLLVAPIAGEDSLNESKLPRTLRLWRRGTALSSARTLYTGAYTDSGLSAVFVATGGRAGFVAVRSLDFFTREYAWVDATGSAHALPLPQAMDIKTVHEGKLLVRLNQDWTVAGQAFKAGSLIALSLDTLLDNYRIKDVEVLYQPSESEALLDVVAANGKLYLSLLRNYRSVVVEVSLAADKARVTTLDLPAEGFISLLGTQDSNLHLRLESPLTPPWTMLYNPTDGTSQVLSRQRASFDASGLTARLLSTTSRDGTEISYTVIGPAAGARSRELPTLVYGYGGFDVSITPRYEPLFGKLWLEKGRVYVHAYLRGGGERGPNWHRSAMLENRVLPYEDMAAILEDLHRRGISSPQQTGIMGRSNGGLMVSALMTRRPELMNAVVIGGPLTDMLHYQNLPPGASWAAEYGDPRRAADARWIARYSPLQRISSDADYPLPLLITSTDDDRVLPGHSRRFAARMRSRGHDALHFEDAQGGHYWELAGGPAPGDWRLRARARAVEFAYLAKQLGPGSAAELGDQAAYGTWPTIETLHQAMRANELSPAVLVERHLAQIERLNPRLKAVVAVDPTAREQARALGTKAAAGSWAGVLHGIPVLIKDNIETRDQPTTAGSLALADNSTGRDAPLVARMRAAGAIILGKTNLSEWANFRSERSSSGWSAVGGQSRNPYNPTRSPCGSSSGSGAAVAAGMAVIAIGTETNGSIVCPSGVNGIVGIKPTVGLVSRTHIVPISHNQDTAGPMARNVRDATLLLSVIVGEDSSDPATTERPPWSAEDLLAHVRANGLEGKRIGVLRSSAGFHSKASALMDSAINAMVEAGAEVVDGLTWDSPDSFSEQSQAVLLYEFKHNINAYLAGLPHAGLSIMTLLDLIEFNRRNRDSEMPWFDQEIFESAQAKGPLTDASYRTALDSIHKAAGADGIDKLLKEHALDALIAPSASPAWSIDLVNGDHYLGGSSSLAAVSGYPNISVPMGQVHGLPVGLSIFGARFSEPVLIEIASGFEHANGGFTPPTRLSKAK